MKLINQHRDQGRPDITLLLTYCILAPLQHVRRVGERWNNELWWGCISASVVDDIVRIDGITNAEKYREVLIHYAIPSGKRLIGNGLQVFQYHNDPKHTANASEIIFGKKNS